MLTINMYMRETGDSLFMTPARQEELHQICQRIVDAGCAGDLNCAETIRVIQKHQDILTAQELIFLSFKMGRVFQIAQDNPPKETVYDSSQ